MRCDASLRSPKMRVGYVTLQMRLTTSVMRANAWRPRCGREKALALRSGAHAFAMISLVERHEFALRNGARDEMCDVAVCTLCDVVAIVAHASTIRTTCVANG